MPLQVLDSRNLYCERPVTFVQAYPFLCYLSPSHIDLPGFSLFSLDRSEVFS